jgi:lipoprotein-anchoring transpeptidase ErfK/SrfK
MSGYRFRTGRAIAIAAVALVVPAASALGSGLIGPTAQGADLPIAESLTGAGAALISNNSIALAHANVANANRVLEQVRADGPAAQALQEQSAGLSAGRYVWQPERAQSGPVEVIVSLAAQRAYIFRARQLIGVTTVSTGRDGHRTPTGTFPILQKKRMHHSNLYNDAPMPNMQRLTWDGVALHAGRVHASPASHGCVRLPLEFSRLLFGVTRIGSVVHVVNDTPPSATAALAYVKAHHGGGRQVASAR